VGLESFNRASRPALYRALASTRWDLVVVGGGITGASIFRDAALRGFKVALVEARDFASGTSSRSSKLVHGGLRYLKTLGIRLARESCRERDLHVRLNKRLVRPVPFLVPLYRGHKPSRGSMRVGMLVYELLSGFRNHRWHRFTGREETLLVAPGIPDEGLAGGCIYYDAMVSDNRWTLETVKDGVRHGGLAMSYAPVEALVLEREKVAGVRVRDRSTRETFEIRGRVVVNATGIFADSIRRLEDPATQPKIRLSKGTHLVFRAEDVPLEITLVLTSPIDGRPLFLVKRDGCFLYGTSDDWDDSPPDSPAPAVKDVAYLLDSLAKYMPEAGLTAEKVQFVYSGFRPLIAEEGRRELDPSQASREDLVETSPRGLVSVMGGKLTTARVMAERVLDELEVRALARAPRPCATGRLSIGGSNEEVAEGLSSWIKRCPELKDYFRTLYFRYGLDASRICAEAHRIFRGEHEDPRAEPIRAEVEYVCRHEMTVTVGDLLDRRAGYLYWSPEKRLERLRYGKHVIEKELGLDDEGFEEQFTAYEAHLKRFHTVPGGV
jgi:glycerol-3-phosphate dehydrogenase